MEKGTWNDLVYHELRRGTIFSKIKDQYYRNLHGNNYKNDIEARNQKIITSEASMISFYRNLELHVKSCSIYNNYMIDINREIISRWRSYSLN